MEIVSDNVRNLAPGLEVIRKVPSSKIKVTMLSSKVFVGLENPTIS